MHRIVINQRRRKWRCRQKRAKVEMYVYCGKQKEQWKSSQSPDLPH